MLLKLYKSNQPFVLLFLPLFAILFWVNSFLHPIDLSSKFYSLISENYNFLHIRFNWINTLLGFFCVLVGAILLNSIANKQKFTDKENYLPALFYVLFCSFYIGQLFLTPILVANIFLLLSLQRFLSIYRQNTVLSECFDTGFLFAISVFFYLPYLLLFPIIYIGLIIIRPFNWREWVLPVLGFCCVFLVFFVCFYLFDIRLQSFSFKNSTFQFPNSFATYKTVGYTFLCLTTLITLLSFSVLIPQYGKSTIQEKNAKLVFIWLMFFLVIIFFIAGRIGHEQIFFTILSIPVSVCFSFYFYLAKKRFWVSILFYIWLSLLVFNFYL